MKTLTIYLRKASKTASYLLLLCVIQACVSTPDYQSWPSSIPPKQIFIDYCLKQNDSCSTPAKTEQHLVWVKRFYFGSILYPTGWNEMTGIVIDTLDPVKNKTKTRQRLNNLGLKIALEWAQDNSIRIINSRMLAIWANALRASTEEGQQIEFITQIESDVDDILSNVIKPSEITKEKYNLVEDYDNF